MLFFPFFLMTDPYFLIAAVNSQILIELQNSQCQQEQLLINQKLENQKTSTGRKNKNKKMFKLI